MLKLVANAYQVIWFFKITTHDDLARPNPTVKRN